jgi:hypothetical protein
MDCSSVVLWRCYINIIVTILDIIHALSFYLIYDVSETGFCIHFQVHAPFKDGDRTQFPKRRVLNKRQDDG